MTKKDHLTGVTLIKKDHLTVLRGTPRDSNHPGDLFQSMLLLGFNNFHIYEKISEVKIGEGSKVLPPKCSTNNKEMTKDTEGTIEIAIGNSKSSCDHFTTSPYTLRTVK